MSAACWWRAVRAAAMAWLCVCSVLVAAARRWSRAACWVCNSSGHSGAVGFWSASWVARAVRRCSRDSSACWAWVWRDSATAARWAACSWAVKWSHFCWAAAWRCSACSRAVAVVLRAVSACWRWRASSSSSACQPRARVWSAAMRARVSTQDWSVWASSAARCWRRSSRCWRVCSRRAISAPAW